ncbi:MAG: MBL fold metallo-hydrolase [Lachnospiraceae bacterium]|nr:MBL fold metallo-hydrolase [Lachnospiraceae bacterium]
MCRYCYNYSSNRKPPTSFTAARNREAAKELGLNQRRCTNREYELASEHCIYPVKSLQLKAKGGQIAWDLDAYSFLEQEEAPDSVNPSLWLNAKSNRLAGVFEVVKDAIYQVRGFDISNLTIIRGKTGWIVQDTMTTIETSRAALELLERALGEEIISKIRAVIISHSHSDHYGGVRGVVAPEQVGRAEDGRIPVFVPAGFDIECVRENIFAGAAMGRRGNYQFGMDLEPGPEGHVSVGIGLSSSKGTMSFVTPTDYIDRDRTIMIDGITVEFQLTPGTEAPAEMNNYFADYQALWMAENCSGTLHNLYPVRGAQLRDSAAWSDYILEAMEKYADKSQVVFQAHNWPHFNTPEHPHEVRDYLLSTAAIYKHTHDQTLLYANEGYTAKEIARKIRIPDGLKQNWYIRPYYGSLPINARAVYTKYLGFFNGNPNDIDPLTEVEAAKAFVEYAGPEEKILEQAWRDFDAGDYRRAAYAAGNVVYANYKNLQARLLCADAFEQLGYAAESSVWRNVYLQGALELRYGVDERSVRLVRGTDIQRCMSVELLLKYLGILFDNERMEQENFSLILNIREDPADAVAEDAPGAPLKDAARAPLKDAPGAPLKDAAGDSVRYVLTVKSGVLLTWKGEGEGISAYADLTKKSLLALVERRLDQEIDSIQTNSYELLKRIERGLTDLRLYARFPMIEARRERE